MVFFSLGETGTRFGDGATLSGILFGDCGTLLGEGAGTLCGAAGIRFGDGATPSGNDDDSLPLGECDTWLGDGIAVLFETR